MADEVQDLLKKYYRLLTAGSDFKRAKLFANLILNEHLYEGPHRNQILLEAINCAMIVSYCRPFIGSKRRRLVDAEPLSGRLLKDYSREERELHDVVIDDRNRALAHSDINARYFTPEVWTIDGNEIVAPWSLDVHAPLTEDAVQRLKAMCQKMILIILRERDQIEPEVRTYFPKIDIKSFIRENRDV